LYINTTPAKLEGLFFVSTEALKSAGKTATEGSSIKRGKFQRAGRFVLSAYKHLAAVQKAGRKTMCNSRVLFCPVMTHPVPQHFVPWRIFRVCIKDTFFRVCD
jgi:hypothetical protein